MTLWQRIKKWLFIRDPVPEVPAEQKLYNPLTAKIGSHVRFLHTLINGRDVSDEVFTVLEIWEWDRQLNGESHKFTEYLFGLPQRNLRLRAIPYGDRPGCELLWMTQYFPDELGPFDWCEDSEGILRALDDKLGEFVNHACTPEEEVYWRDMKRVPCSVTVIRDKNFNGVVDASEVWNERFELWTFRRSTRDNDQSPLYEQHLHAQYDLNSRQIWIGRGEIVPLENVVIH